MAIEWSDNILLANLSDEPALSEELSLAIDKINDAEEAPHTVLDFRAVSYVNSSNIAQLLRLLDPAHGCARKCRGDLVAAMAEDDVDPCVVETRRHIHHVREQGPAGQRLQDLRQAGTHPRPLARSEDDDVQ